MIRAYGHSFRIVQADSLKSAAIALDVGNYDLVLLDLSFNDDNKLGGLNIIAPYKKLVPQTPINVVTKDQKSSTSVEAIKRGADNFVRKDEFDIRAWNELFGNTIAEAKSQIRTADAPGGSAGYPFIGETPEILKIKRKLVKLSERPDYTVLILGDTGVGKGVAARHFHKQGARSHQN